MTTISYEVASMKIASAPLEPWPLDPAQVISGDPQASGTLLWKSEDSTLAAGIWACTPGSFNWDHVDETLVVLEGRATVEREHGDPVELAPGIVAFFAEGLHSRWTVHEPLRKAFHLHSTQPLAL